MAYLVLILLSANITAYSCPKCDEGSRISVKEISQHETSQNINNRYRVDSGSIITAIVPPSYNHVKGMTMAEDDNEAKEPDGTENAASANAGSSQRPNPRATATATATQPPDFDALQENISETRKPAGPDFPDAPVKATGPAAESEEETIGPSDPS